MLEGSRNDITTPFANVVICDTFVVNVVLSKVITSSDPELELVEPVVGSVVEPETEIGVVAAAVLELVIALGGSTTKPNVPTLIAHRLPREPSVIGEGIEIENGLLCKAGLITPVWTIIPDTR